MNTSPKHPDASAFAAARRVLSGAQKVADDHRTAEIFPAEAYTNEDFWRFERWAVFEREWLCIGHEKQIPRAGDYFTISVLDEPLVATRNDAGDIRVLSAICQHRGHPLFDGLAASPGPCGHTKRFVCPYHAWSYTLDGDLFAAPGMSRTASLEEVRRRSHLPVIRHEIVQGLIFINFDERAAPLQPRLTKMLAMTEEFNLAGLLPMDSTDTPIRSNWKIYQENSLEPYHTDVVHRTSHNPAPARLSAFYDYEPGDGAIMTTTGFAAESELFAAPEQESLPQIPGLTAEQQGRLLFVAVLPTLFLLFEPGSVLVTLALPKGANAMTLRTFPLYPREAVESQAFAASAAAQAAALKGIVAEDLVTQEALQRGHHSRFTPNGMLSWLEATIPQMNGWLVERYRAALSEAIEPAAASAS